MIANAISDILKAIGEDPTREGLVDTPKRFEKSFQFLTSGYKLNPKEVVGNALYKAPSTDRILVRDIQIFSLCEHHLLPFFGVCHVAYLPSKKIIGLSKIPRVIEVFSRRLQVQERLNREIATSLSALLDARGIAVFIEASHLCMRMRGVEEPGSLTSTQTFLGAYQESSELRRELLTEIYSLRTTAPGAIR